MAWRDKFKVHPAANQFPMMSKRALYELGKDIKAHRLKNPIVVWRDKDPTGVADRRTQSS